MKKILLFLYAIFCCSAISNSQNLNTLYSFQGTNGFSPYISSTVSGSVLYGVTTLHGSNFEKIMFRINTDGTGFTSLHSFYGRCCYSSTPTISGTVIYGTTHGLDTTEGYGSIYRINTDGSGFTTLHSFSISDGVNPSGLILFGSALFGITSGGGTNGYGTIFKINTDGSGFSTVYSFPGSEGAFPDASLTLSGSTLYGTTWWGGTYGYGIIFKINTDGTGYSTLHSFSNLDGIEVYNPLILVGSTLYGTTYEGGTMNDGTIFKINTDGSGFTRLYSFSYLASAALSSTLSGKELYGITKFGNTIFKINTDGTGFDTLYSFTNPYCSPLSLTLSGTTFYGTTDQNAGTIFSYSLAIKLPTVLTNSITNIQDNFANGGGNVTDDGGSFILARGVCWNTTGNPTTNDNSTSDGTGTGSFLSSITGLKPLTTYHVRAYAINEKGISYGDEKTFKTLLGAPTCLPATNRDTTSATLNWTANPDNGSEPFTYSIFVNWFQMSGFYYNFGYYNTTGIANSETSFKIPLNTLPPETNCNYKVFGVDNGVTGAYSNMISFWTLSCEPKRHANTFTTEAVSGSEIDLSFEAANNITDCKGYLIIERTDKSPSWTPTKGQGYSAGNTFSDDSIAAIITDPSATSYPLTDLSTGSHYYFTLIPFNWNGTNAETYNYHNSATVPQADAQTFDNPTVITGKASKIGPDSAIISGIVFPNGSETTVKIEYGVSPLYGKSVEFDDSPVDADVVKKSLKQAINGLFSNTLYFYRVTATNEAGIAFGANSLFITDTTAADCPFFQDSTVEPSNLRATTIDIGWSKGSGTGSMVIMKAGSAIVNNDLPVTFRVYPAYNNNFSVAPKIGSARIIQYGASNKCYISGLNVMSTYYVMICGYYGNPHLGTARFNRNPAVGNPRIFRTPRARDGEDNAVPGEGFFLGNIYPNPTKDKLEFSFTNSSDDYFTIELLSEDGKKVLTYVENRLFEAGSHQMEINISKFSNGSYTLVVKTGNNLAFSKFIILK